MVFPANTDVITLPEGATTGARVVIDGSNNSIRFYDASNILIGTLNASGLVFSPADGSKVTVGLNGAARINLNGPPRAGHVIGDSYIYTETDPAQGFPYTLYRSPQLDASDLAYMILQSGDTSVAQGSYVDLHATQRISLKSNSVISSGPIHAKTPGSGMDTPVQEPWNALAFNGALGVPWTNQGGAQVQGKYRMVPSPAFALQIVGELKAGTKVDGTVIATLPVGYRPSSVVTFPVAMNPGTLGSMTPLLQITTGGSIVCYGMAAAAAPIVYVNALVPLDV